MLPKKIFLFIIMNSNTILIQKTKIFNIYEYISCDSGGGFKYAPDILITYIFAVYARNDFQMYEYITLWLYDTVRWKL